MARYRIVPERSMVTIHARSNLHPIRSSTDGLEGYVELDLQPDGGVDLAARAAARLSLPVHLLSSGNPLEDRELQKRIDARRYPTIEGVLKEMEHVGTNSSYRVRGEITFRGVSRHHSDQMIIRPLDDKTIMLTGNSRFDIRDFGMQPPRVLMLKVDPEVEVGVDIVAEKEG